MTFRAFVDVRAVDGRFVLQFREGLEGSIQPCRPRAQIAAIAQLYVGYRVIPILGLGLEAFETYLIDSPDITTNAEDHNRATFTIFPELAPDDPYVQPALGFVTSVGTPLVRVRHRRWLLGPPRGGHRGVGPRDEEAQGGSRDGPVMVRA